ncbi:GNAT family N-acetyltransferase [Pseudovibrio flavus]|uniref:GNAT family N-acetyltransferase n=1 Tax=Pseudovibrio flavus TaxID=2529854 RepID=UPI00211C3B24|nr:GNAT family N-acetyltransferase [Pseudovibrio flavus]
MAITEAEDLYGAKDVDFPLVFRLEQSNVNCFPALMNHLDRTWISRLYPDNPSRRINSLNCYDPVDGVDAAERLEAAQQLFRRHNVPFHVRWTPLVPAELDEEMNLRRWERYSDSSVLERTIFALGEADLPDGYRIERSDLSVWMKHFEAVGGTDISRVTPEALASLKGSLVCVPLEKLCLSVLDAAGKPCAVLLGVLDGDCLGIFDVATDPAERRKGFAHSLVVEAQRMGAEAGAIRAWLQVDGKNEAAKRLYGVLGYRETYRYHYCRPQV